MMMMAIPRRQSVGQTACYVMILDQTLRNAVATDSSKSSRNAGHVPASIFDLFHVFMFCTIWQPLASSYVLEFYIIPGTPEYMVYTKY